MTDKKQPPKPDKPIDFSEKTQRNGVVDTLKPPLPRLPDKGNGNDRSK